MSSRDAEKWKGVDVFLYCVLFLLVVCVAFQLYGRYTYVSTRATTVVRIDRLSGESCTMPCDDTSIRESVAAVPKYAEPLREAKTCRSANVVRVESRLRIPHGHKPVPYRLGGFDAASPAKALNVISDATELSDGHVYAFTGASFNAVSTWSTGEEVRVCATWSKIEHRPFYSVGPADVGEPATLAI